MEKINVYHIADSEYWASKLTKEQTIRAYMDYYEENEENDGLAEATLIDLSEEMLIELDDGENEYVTYADYIQRMIEEGETFDDPVAIAYEQ